MFFVSSFILCSVDNQCSVAESVRRSNHWWWHRQCRSHFAVVYGNRYGPVDRRWWIDTKTCADIRRTAHERWRDYVCMRLKQSTIPNWDVKKLWEKVGSPLACNFPIGDSNLRFLFFVFGLFAVPTVIILWVTVQWFLNEDCSVKLR